MHGNEVSHRDVIPASWAGRECSYRHSIVKEAHHIGGTGSLRDTVGVHGEARRGIGGYTRQFPGTEDAPPIIERIEMILAGAQLVLQYIQHKVGVSDQ